MVPTASPMEELVPWPSWPLEPKPATPQERELASSGWVGGGARVNSWHPRARTHTHTHACGTQVLFVTVFSFCVRVFRCTLV